MKKNNKGNFLYLFLILLLSAMLSCKSEKISQTINNIDESVPCKDYFVLKSDCDRVSFLEKNYGKINQRCLEEITNDLATCTKIPASLMPSCWMGLFYADDSTFQSDISAWKNKLGCPLQKEEVDSIITK